MLRPRLIVLLAFAVLVLAPVVQAGPGNGGLPSHAGGPHADRDEPGDEEEADEDRSRGRDGQRATKSPIHVLDTSSDDGDSDADAVEDVVEADSVVEDVEEADADAVVGEGTEDETEVGGLIDLDGGLVCGEDEESVGPIQYQADRDNQTVELDSLADAEPGDRLRAFVWVTEVCLALQVSLATYELHDRGDGPTLFDSENATLEIGNNIVEWATTPPCSFEARLTVGGQDGEIVDSAVVEADPCDLADQLPQGPPIDVPGNGNGIPVELPDDGAGGAGSEPIPVEDPRLQDPPPPEPAPAPSGGGGSAAASETPEVTVEPEAPQFLELPPIAYLEVDARIMVAGDMLELSAVHSYSPVGSTIFQYRFLLPDGTWTEWGPDDTVTIEVGSVGTHRVGVQVQDADGLTSANSATVLIHALEADSPAAAFLDGRSEDIPVPPLPAFVVSLVGVVALRRLHMRRRA